jgi:hypothetical protein
LGRFADLERALVSEKEVVVEMRVSFEGRSSRLARELRAERGTMILLYHPMS